MSVVNKMLSDLEKRSKPARPNANYVPSKSGEDNNKTVVILLAILLFLGTLLAWLLLREQTPITSKVTTANSEVVKIDEHSTLATSLDGQAKGQVVLEGKVLSSQVNSPEKLALKEPAADVQNEVEVILDGESMADLVNRLSQSVEQLQAISLQASTTENPSALNSIAKSSDLQSQITVVPDTPSEPEKAIKTPKSSMSVAASNADSSVSNLQQEIDRQLQTGDKAGAIKNLARLLALQPRNISARKKLASLHFGSGNPASASELLQQGIALAPSDSSMRLMLARLLFRSEQADRSLELLKAHPRTVIADDELLSFRAALAEQRGDYQQAIQDYSLLIERQSNNARWWLGLAVSQDKESLKQDALVSYRQVQKLNQLSEQVSTFVQQRLSVLEG